jgi:hypothetical protein
MVTKQRWVEIMQAAGLSEQAMENRHRQFEKMKPAVFIQAAGTDTAR